MDNALSLCDESAIFAELDNKRPMLDIHKNPLLVSILQGCEILKALTEKDMLPQHVMETAKGFLIMKTDKVGFGISLLQGHGVVIQRAPNRASGWSPPLPVKVDGFSFGAVIGFSEALTLVALADDQDVNAFKAEKRSLKLGLDVGLSLMDKFDKSQSVTTDAIQQAGDLAKTQAFTISKGVLVDFALMGTSVEADKEDIFDSYGKGVTAAQILDGSVPAPRESALLYKYLNKACEKFSTSVVS